MKKYILLMTFCAFSNLFSVGAAFDKELQKIAQRGIVELRVVSEFRLYQSIVSGNLAGVITVLQEIDYEGAQTVKEKALVDFAKCMLKNVNPDDDLFRNYNRIIALLENYDENKRYMAIWKQTSEMPGYEAF